MEINQNKRMNKDHHIENEGEDLNGLSPQLNGLNGKNPFNPSEAYFDAFTSKLQNRIEDEEDIRAMAPTLLSIDRYNPFEVPAEYFDELPTIIQEKAIADKKAPAILGWLQILFRPRFAVPLILTIVIAFSGIGYLNTDSDKNVETEELSLEDNLYYISENDIIDQLTADASLNPSADAEDENSIENYLIDNNIDESNLSLEL